jgi:hypothetical protein
MLLQHSNTSTELHPFVKLTIAYAGIMAGFAVLGLAFYVTASTAGSVGAPRVMQFPAVSYYVALAGMSVVALWLLKNGRRAGAYVAFAALAISVFAPISGPAYDSFTIVYWFAIPNAAVGVLLLKAFRTLR